jgi:hypothetical protein
MAANQSAENPEPSRINATGTDNKKAVTVTRPNMFGAVRLVPVDLPDCNADFDKTARNAKNKLLAIAAPKANQEKLLFPSLSGFYR